MNWRDAPATYGVAALTLIASAVVLLLGWLPQAALAGGFIPARIGAEGVVAPVALLPVWLTPLSTTLVHGGLLHLGFNLLMLVYAGRQAEHALGTPGMLMLYLAGAYASVAGQWLASPESTVPMIGASGAISAVIGAYALLFGERRAKALGPVPAGVVHVAWLAAGWIVVQLLIGATDGDQPVAIAAHIGGFLAGLALARPLLLWRWRGA
ncbi:rhomboid family intramembrane serine protease [Sphingomonas sp.]|jgi:membrane associated rhomboid family serine protease|uniref:rhomboid family intramembrane serine protease n=1 Tax=Sphingomonas sp. TaxID=28214 RepID=UPI002D7FE039|nr:rhomboid family intramembrane serine protease [Sphingomonas sp.]HEU0045139.1 rhomboid family intramembrane serine protease [Sphingomonas sp.]